MSGTQGKQQAEQPSPHEHLVGQTLSNGEYTLQRVIGQGGMGKVYLAAHASLTIPLAIKQARADEPLPESVSRELDTLLHERSHSKHTRIATKIDMSDFPSSGGEHTDRFLREALFLARLHHPAIPSLYDYFFENGYWYLVMDYVPGATLQAYVRQYAPLAPLEAINYAMQLCDVLDYLHKQSPPIIYRDMKPANVILSPDGIIMLIDFGIARYFKEGQINDTTDFGSPGYASPEQYREEGQTDARSDLYSLGVILHEMLTANRPNALTNIARDSAQQLNPTISTVLSGLVTLATRADPMYRIQSAHTFYIALDRVYHIEEQRAYERYIRQEPRSVDEQGDEDTIQVLDQSSTPPRTQVRGGSAPRIEALSDTQLAPEQQNVPPVPTQLSPSLTLDQRKQTREVLQHARTERIEQEHIELQLASVDKSLQMRTSMPLSQQPRPFAISMDDEEPRTRSKRVHRLIRASFIIALLIFFILASLLVYTRVFRHEQKLVKGIQITAIASHTSIQSSWSILPSLSSPLADNTAVYVEVDGHPYIYMSGGYRGAKSSPHYDRHLYRYDINAAHWEQVALTSFPGMVNNAVTQDEHGQLFFTIGYSPDTYTVSSLLYQYHPSDNTIQKITPPTPISIGFGAAMLADQHGHLYLTQGFLKSGDPHALAETGWYRYDTATNQWHTLAPLPKRLGYSVLATDDVGNIILLGGASDAGQHTQTQDIYRYNIAQNAWTLANAQAPFPMSGVASCTPQAGQLVIIGGYDVSQDKGRTQSWLVDLHTLHWTALNDLPTGGSILGAAASDGKDHIYLVRGASDPNLPTGDFWEMTIRQ